MVISTSSLKCIANNSAISSADQLLEKLPSVDFNESQLNKLTNKQLFKHLEGLFSKLPTDNSNEIFEKISDGVNQLYLRCTRNKTLVKSIPEGLKKSLEKEAISTNDFLLEILKSHEKPSNILGLKNLCDHLLKTSALAEISLPKETFSLTAKAIINEAIYLRRDRKITSKFIDKLLVDAKEVLQMADIKPRIFLNSLSPRSKY